VADYRWLAFPAARFPQTFRKYNADLIISTLKDHHGSQRLCDTQAKGY
jgi:hypothetical protein